VAAAGRDERIGPLTATVVTIVIMRFRDRKVSNSPRPSTHSSRPAPARATAAPHHASRLPP
jgi:hypothetical protein